LNDAKSLMISVSCTDSGVVISVLLVERVIALADATIETARPARCDGQHEDAVLAANAREVQYWNGAGPDAS